MSEFAQVFALSETEACQAIAAAVAEGVRAEPERAAGKLIDSLRAAFGPIVQKIVALIESGTTSLPAILEALAVSGVVLPSWVYALVTILLTVTKQT